MPEPRTKRGQKESGRAEARPLPAQLFTRLAVEDVIADRRDALQAPAGRNVAGMKEQRVSDRGFLQPLVDDPGDRDGSLPLAVAMRDARQAVAVHERELAALEQHAAVGPGEAPAARGAVGDHPADGKLAGERLALRLEIDSGGEAIELAAAWLGRTKLRDHRREVAARLDREDGVGGR